MVDVEPYGSSDLGGDPSDDERPSLTSDSPSEDDDPEDPDKPSGKKKKKKRKSKRHKRRRSKEAKAITSSKIVLNMLQFTRKDLSEFAESFGRFLRMTRQAHASGRLKCDLLKRYPEPMAHGPEACEPSHPLWPMAQRPASRHTRAEAVDTGSPCSLTREIWNPISNQ